MSEKKAEVQEAEEPKLSQDNKSESSLQKSKHGSKEKLNKSASVKDTKQVTSGKDNADSEAPSEIFSHSEPQNDFKTPTNKDIQQEQPNVDLQKEQPAQNTVDVKQQVQANPVAHEPTSEVQMPVVQEVNNENNESSSQDQAKEQIQKPGEEQEAQIQNVDSVNQPMQQDEIDQPEENAAEADESPHQEEEQQHILGDQNEEQEQEDSARQQDHDEETDVNYNNQGHPLIDYGHQNQSFIEYQQQMHAQENLDDVDALDGQDDEDYPYPEDGYSQNLYEIGDSIARRVEQEKLAKIYFDSHDLRQKLAVVHGRCEICTLKPPCRHNKNPSVVNHPIAEEDVQYEDPQAGTAQHELFQNNVHSMNQYPVGLNESSTQQISPRINKISHESDGSPQSQMAKPSNRSTRLFHHQQKMAKMNGGDMSAVNTSIQSFAPEYVSPYSILRSSRQIDVTESIETMKNLAIKQSTGGARSTRSEILRQLALKNKMKQNPMLQKHKRLTKEEVSAVGFDPLAQNSVNSYNSSNSPKMQQGRIRNKRGEYQSIDGMPSMIMPSMRSKNGSSTAGNSNRANYKGQFMPQNDINKAENRLRVIEQISKFREEKIKREFLKLEEELRIEEEKNKQKYEREIRNQEYFRQQKDRLYQYQKVKQLKEMAENQIKNEELLYDQMKDDQRRMRNEENKLRLQQYRQHKAEEMLETQKLEHEQLIFLMEEKRKLKKMYKNNNSRQTKKLMNSIDVTGNRRNGNQSWQYQSLDQSNDQFRSPMNQMQWDRNGAQTIEHTEYETLEQEDKNKNNKDQNDQDQVNIGQPQLNEESKSPDVNIVDKQETNFSLPDDKQDQSPKTQLPEIDNKNQNKNEAKYSQKSQRPQQKQSAQQHDQNVRASLDNKLKQSSQEENMRTKKYKGGSVKYRSIEKPLRLYSHGMRSIDITNQGKQKEIRNKYVENYHQEAYERNQILNAIHHDQFILDRIPKAQAKKKAHRKQNFLGAQNYNPKQFSLKPLNYEQKKQLNPDSATNITKNDSIQELKAEQELDQTEAAKTQDDVQFQTEAEPINIQVSAEAETPQN